MLAAVKSSRKRSRQSSGQCHAWYVVLVESIVAWSLYLLLIKCTPIASGQYWWWHLSISTCFTATVVSMLEVMWLTILDLSTVYRNFNGALLIFMNNISGLLPTLCYTNAALNRHCSESEQKVVTLATVSGQRSLLSAIEAVSASFELVNGDMILVLDCWRRAWLLCEVVGYCQYCVNTLIFHRIWRVAWDMWWVWLALVKVVHTCMWAMNAWVKVSYIDVVCPTLALRIPHKLSLLMHLLSHDSRSSVALMCDLHWRL